MVDDEEFCLAAMKQLLLKCNIDVAACVDFCIDGEESLRTIRVARDHKIKYKLILTDFSMPRLDGINSTKAIRAFLQGVPK